MLWRESSTGRSWPARPKLPEPPEDVDAAQTAYLEQKRIRHLGFSALEPNPGKFFDSIWSKTYLRGCQRRWNRRGATPGRTRSKRGRSGWCRNRLWAFLSEARKFRPPDETPLRTQLIEWKTNAIENHLYRSNHWLHAAKKLILSHMPIKLNVC